MSVAFGSGTPETNLSKPYWTRFDFSKDIILATGHTNGRIRIWNTQTGKLMLELMDHKSAVRALNFAPDGSLRLISASLDKTLKVSCKTKGFSLMQLILKVNHGFSFDFGRDGT